LEIFGDFRDGSDRVNMSFDLGYFSSQLSILKYVARLKPTVACFHVFFLPAKPQIMHPCITDHPEMDKSKKEEAKLEAEETFWEGPPSSTEALQTRRDSDSIRSFNHVGVAWCDFL